ncbi:MAG: Type 4 prepilin-like protein leader peptide-processing enzyme [Candidatus Woesebacteria bacterium GW2011_GWC2_33_12]|uniref:Type 4 prepilin-like protein leader peptide-processing enzyme n=1 Tax=Candidatus Woesebacteria bacterium GW2011_GWB1_33_22 TaxID=1618566 RepID=A0A0F9ZM93_9BACT|nr:MAG: Type 4 prepilin-like protein leader peptide-processing enzyme [Candidatus Woesebacteria bacterium GW2011_GWC2_33_12]KKP42501.1 MAG: Type 4 prepilin-like protein leader peptide-processing enzyme [Candidatus Woesebacteria bacterium GW2011_GWA2_33_20]KKP45244.1 MAG: Type 4 prepilin-like protein leader peptide-processing enzyme [Candidatus Woesebacteria bacterium GW2011_GWB1_33_22]KKP46461.1 MAG: Type 4 prepilin-like protein leader peptide-processing enzyme [Microgenomates group bacterium GW
MFVFLNNVGMVELTLLTLLGLVIGSFVSLITYRIPRGLGFISGRSFCDLCKEKLAWYDNIPLVSFLRYRGKSRCCSKKISIRYPLIELATAIGFVFLYPNFVLILLFLLTFSILIIDVEHQIIPDELSWLVLFLGLLSPITYTLYPSLFAGFLSALVLLFIHLITKGRGMGLGDVKLAIALGLWLTVDQSLIWLMTAFIIGGIVSVFLLLLRQAKLKTKIAFGPFLIIAFWIILLT